jgi:hypothetical protein
MMRCFLCCMPASHSVAAAPQTYMQHRSRGWERGRLSADDGQREAQLMAEVREVEVGVRPHCPLPHQEIWFAPPDVCAKPCTAFKAHLWNAVARVVHPASVLSPAPFLASSPKCCCRSYGQVTLEAMQSEADRARNAAAPAKERMDDALRALRVLQQQKVRSCCRPLRPPPAAARASVCVEERAAR